MALKDWNKSQGIDRWWNDKNKYIEITITKTEKGWSVFKNNISPKNWSFKSKSQALKFAKQYMRSH